MITDITQIPITFILASLTPDKKESIVQNYNIIEEYFIRSQNEYHSQLIPNIAEYYNIGYHSVYQKVHKKILIDAYKNG